MSCNLDFLPLNNKVNHIRISKNFDYWSRQVNLIASFLMVVYVHIKDSLVFLPSRHVIAFGKVVFILSTWLNIMLIYPRGYSIHVDNTKHVREEAGRKIAENPDQIKRIDDNFYQVKSQSVRQTGWYDVVSTESGFTCTCPDCHFRQRICKHIHAVLISLKLRKEVRKPVIIEQVAFDKCPHCESINYVKHGIKRNKHNNLQRYYCNDCKKWFTFNLGFNGIKVNPKIVTSALQLYFTGESLRGVQKFLRLQGVEVSHQSIYNWIKKYTKLMDEYLKTITPQLGDKWRADEVWLKVKGDRKYLFAMMDEDTRFWIAQEVADTKFRHDARNLLSMGKQIAGKVPATFITDGLHAYNDAFNKEFRTLRAPQPEHIRHIHITGDKNNNMMERLNGEFRDREKTFRGLKKDDSPAITGIQLYHNYIRPHTSLNGETPADRAGIIIRGNDKWRTLIENASKA